MADNYWSDKYNALPKEVRTISCAISGEAHIRQIQSTIGHLKRQHRQQIRELNEQIKSMESWHRSQFPVPKENSNESA